MRRVLFLIALLSSVAMTACDSGGSSTSPVTVPPGSPPPPPPPPTGSNALRDAAKTFPVMPKDLAALLALRPGTSTFASGTPYNDLEYTLFDTDYVEGETNGFDTFMPVNPSRTTPGADQIKIVNAVNNVDLNSAYDGQDGDRIILGTAEIAAPFFSRGANGVDDDYLVITNFDYNNGSIQLRGQASDYGILRCTLADGCATDGFYLFYTAAGAPDLIAFIHRCDDLALPISGAAPRAPKGLCNVDETLSLTNASQFTFASPLPSIPVMASSAIQFGSSGNEIVGGVAADQDGNTYVLGATDGNLVAGAQREHAVFVSKVAAGGAVAWHREIELSNGSLLFDAVADDQFLYVVGRTLGALPGFVNRGRWDGIILKIRLTDGTLVASDQFGNEGLDGYGNITLDDSGHLFVSGAGSRPGPASTDPYHLIAKHRISDLGNVWRVIEAPDAAGQIFVSEAWGGLTYIAGNQPGQGRLVAGGWLMSAGGANGWLEVWESLTQAAPARTASTTIASSGNQAVWVLDNVADANGNIYAVGYTTGSLGSPHRGNGDAYIVRYDSNLTNPVFVQTGTPESDGFRKLAITPTGTLIATGYSYGNYARANTDLLKRTGDVIVQIFDQNLNAVRSAQFGTAAEDRAHAKLQGATLHLGGMTEAALGSASSGSFDAFALRVGERRHTYPAVTLSG